MHEAFKIYNASKKTKEKKKKVNYIIVSRWSSQYSLLGSTTATTAHRALSPATRNNN
jgi:hypothetical protein